MLFSEIAGQEIVKQQLRNSVNAGRIPHAQLFFGTEGSGTLPMAIAYARYVACTSRTENDSCTTCPSCRKFAKLQHPDLHFAFPVNTGKKVSKDPVSDEYIQEWREFVLENPYFNSAQWYDFIGLENKQGIISKNESEGIIRKLSLKPFESDYKFMIIWLPEKMNATSGNMLLKLIEEPPPNTIFLLVSEDPGLLLITISSRTQPVKLSRIDDQSMAAALKSRFQLPEDQLENVVRLANGNFVQARELVQSSADNEFNFQKFTEIMRLCWSRKFLDINEWVDEMSTIGREKLKGFFQYSLRMVRENLMLHVNNAQLSYLTEKEEGFSKKFYPFINGSNVLQIYEEINRASADIERNAYAKIVLFDFSLHLVKLIRQKAG